MNAVAAPKVFILGDLHLRYHKFAIFDARLVRRRDVGAVGAGRERPLERLGQPRGGAASLSGWRNCTRGAARC